MIIYKKGNLVKAPEYIIAHGCNALGVMGSGVAKEIRKVFPKAYEDYRNIYKIDKNSLILGKIIWSPQKNKLIANCITQTNYGKDGKRYVNYLAVGQCMWGINQECKLSGIHSFALPKIGAGLGGGDWKIIEEIILDECRDTQPVVYEY